MKTWYDSTEDVLNIQFAEGDYWKSVELPDGIVIDVRSDGKILGLEIPRASEVFSGDVKKVIDHAASTI